MELTWTKSQTGMAKTKIASNLCQDQSRYWDWIGKIEIMK
jgi:hypothetical protein